MSALVMPVAEAILMHRFVPDLENPARLVYCFRKGSSSWQNLARADFRNGLSCEAPNLGRLHRLKH